MTAARNVLSSLGIDEWDADQHLLTKSEAAFAVSMKQGCATAISRVW